MIFDSTSITERRQHAPLVTVVKTRGNSYSSVQQSLSVAQNVTSSWVDVGSIIDMGDFDYLNAFISLTINDSLDVRFRGVVQIEENPSVDYNFLIEIVSTDKVLVSPEYAELARDEDSNVVLEFRADGVRYIQLQVQAGTVGATPATVDNIFVQRKTS
jgi:hypothetical protein